MMSSRSHGGRVKIVICSKENSLKKSLPAFLVIGASLLGFASLLAHPCGTAKIPASSKPLLAGAPVDPAVMQIVERSCQNCHSERTDWPWYSYVAPMSWLIERDVQQGRSHMNLSHWDEYGVQKREDTLAEISAMTRSRQMPPTRYLRLHPHAKLSDEEIDLIYQWARAERKRL